MAIGILAAALGLLIGAAAIIIPQIVNRRNNPLDDSDSQAYLERTGRSAQDIARGNAAVRAYEQKNDAGSQQAGSADGPTGNRAA